MDSTEVSKQKKSDENARMIMALPEKKNGVPKRPRMREITSRFMSANISSSGAPISSVTKCPSPKTLLVPEIQSKRAQSVHRRQPSPFPSRVLDTKVEEVDVSKPALGPNSETDKVNADQSTSRPAANAVHRSSESPLSLQSKGALERKGAVVPLYGESWDQSENAKPMDNMQSKPTGGKVSGNPISRSVNNVTERPVRVATPLGQAALSRARTPRPISLAGRPLPGSINEEAGGVVALSAADGLLPLDGKIKGTPMQGAEKNAARLCASGRTISGGEEANQIGQLPPCKAKMASSYGGIEFSDVASSVESLSSDCSLAQDATVSSQESTSPDPTVPARYWKETNSRYRGLSEIRSSMPEPELSSATSARARSTGHSGPAIGAGRLSKSSTSPWLVSGSQSMASPVSVSQQSISPVKIITTSSPPSRCLRSPTRARGQPLPPCPPYSQNIRNSNAVSVLNFGAEARKGKKGTNQEDAHLLRILHNRHLQWRFVNARAEAALNAQRIAAEKMLYNVWVKNSELRDSVTMKRIELQQARQRNKLRSILSGQMAYLNDWGFLEQDHSSALSGAIKALQAATLQLPLTGGVRAGIQEVKAAVNSAVDVMDAMSSSVCSLLPKAEDMNSLVSELAGVAAQERALLYECGDLLAAAGALEVEESSLRAHLIQLKQNNGGRVE